MSSVNSVKPAKSFPLPSTSSSSSSSPPSSVSSNSISEPVAPLHPSQEKVHDTYPPYCFNNLDAPSQHIIINELMQRKVKSMKL